MDITNKIGNLLGSPNPYTPLIAHQIESIHDAYNTGSIAGNEARDLLNDMTSATSLIMLVKDLQEKILIQEVISDIIAIVSAVGI